MRKKTKRNAETSNRATNQIDRAGCRYRHQYRRTFAKQLPKNLQKTNKKPCNNS